MQLFWLCVQQIQTVPYQLMKRKNVQITPFIFNHVLYRYTIQNIFFRVCFCIWIDGKFFRKLSIVCTEGKIIQVDSVHNNRTSEKSIIKWALAFNVIRCWNVFPLHQTLFLIYFWFLFTKFRWFFLLENWSLSLNWLQMFIVFFGF